MTASNFTEILCSRILLHIGSVAGDNLSRRSSGSRDISQASTYGYGQDNAFRDYRVSLQLLYSVRPTNFRW
jgi:hypothetical protein